MKPCCRSVPVLHDIPGMLPDAGSKQRPRSSLRIVLVTGDYSFRFPQTFPDTPDCPDKVNVDRTLGYSCGLRDLRNVHFLDVTQKERRTLLFRETKCGFPYRLNLFVHGRSLFRRNTSIGPLAQLVALYAFRLFPELESAASR